MADHHPRGSCLLRDDPDLHLLLEGTGDPSTIQVRPDGGRRPGHPRSGADGEHPAAAVGTESGGRTGDHASMIGFPGGGTGWRMDGIRVRTWTTGKAAMHGRFLSNGLMRSLSLR